MPTFEEIRERDKLETLDYHNFEEWHAAGYRGENINFLEIESPDDDHGKQVVDNLKMDNYEGNCYLGTMSYRVTGDEVIFCNIKYYDSYIPIAQFIEELNIHLIGASLSLSSEINTDGMPKPLIEYLGKLPVVFIGSAGNQGSLGVTGKFENLGIMSAAIYLDKGEIKKESYSAIEDTVDFSTLHNWNEGTSFSSPVLLRMAADIMTKYGVLTQNKLYEVFKSIVIDAGEEGKDPYFGWGVPILPEDCKIQILEEIPIEEPIEPPIQEEPPIEEPIEEGGNENMSNMYMYLVRYGHFEKILCKTGDVTQADILWYGTGTSPATEIGISGNTGLSTGVHTHIDVVKVPYDLNFRYKKYTQQDIDNGNPPADRTELYYFLDKTLFKDDFKITTHFDDQEYLKQFNRVHKGGDIVSLGKKTVFWNRSTRGRVIHTGYDDSYGLNVVIAYFDVNFNSYENAEAPIIIEEPSNPLEIEGNNDLSATWQNSVSGFMYHMVNGNTEKSTYGQTSEFDGKVRYIKLHPNNLGIIEAKGTIEETGYSGINGTFFWYIDDAKTKTYPTSILKVKNKVLRENANHLPYPQGVFCYYQDGTFGMEQIKYARELSKPTWWAIGGTEYVRDSMVTYNATAEGFVGDYADVHRRTTQSSIGITKEGKILLVRHWDSDRAECAIQMREMGCVYAVGLDGGGSTQYATPGAKKLSSREVDNLLVAKDLKL